MNMAFRMRHVTPKAAKILALAAFMLAGNGAWAGDASPWETGHYAKTRLLSGRIAGTAGENQIVAGVQIKLDAGWKTYWRNPGDSGLPPSFDWSGSKNLKSAKVLWPAPHRFSDSYGTSIGYTGDVMFPVEIAPQRKGEPVDLDLKLDYAICKDICVPAEAKLKLIVDGEARGLAGSGAEIARQMTLVPGDAGDAGTSGAEPGGPRIERAKAALDGPKPSIVVEARFPNGIKGADLFAEGGAEIYLPPPQMIEKTGATSVRFTIEIAADADAPQLKGRDVRLTLVSDGGASEMLWRVE